MPVRERKRSTLAAELATLLDAGDYRAAAERARRALAADETGAADRDAAEVALARVRPDRATALTAAAGFLLLAAAALLGLFR